MRRLLKLFLKTADTVFHNHLVLASSHMPVNALCNVHTGRVKSFGLLVMLSFTRELSQ